MKTQDLGKIVNLALNGSIVSCAKNLTQLYSKNWLVKSSEYGFIFLLAFYLIMCLMEAKKNFEKIAILKTRELVSFYGVKTHFGQIALKWCIFRHEKRKILTNIIWQLLIQLRFIHTKHLKLTIWISFLWKISI